MASSRTTGNLSDGRMEDQKGAMAAKGKKMACVMPPGAILPLSAILFLLKLFGKRSSLIPLLLATTVSRLRHENTEDPLRQYYQPLPLSFIVHDTLSKQHLVIDGQEWTDISTRSVTVINVCKGSLKIISLRFQDSKVLSMLHCQFLRERMAPLAPGCVLDPLLVVSRMLPKLERADTRRTSRASF